MASLNLIGEPMIQVTFFTLCTLILMQSQEIPSPKSCGEDCTKDIFHPSHRLESCGRKVGTSLGTSEGSKPCGSPVERTEGPTQSLDHLISSSDPDLCPSPCQSLTITVLLVVDSYYLLKKMGRNLTSTSLMAYLKYSFDIEDGLSNSKSTKQYGSPYSLPDLEQHESSYNLLTQWDHEEKLCNIHSSGKP